MKGHIYTYLSALLFTGILIFGSSCDNGGDSVPEPADNSSSSSSSASQYEIDVEAEASSLLSDELMDCYGTTWLTSSCTVSHSNGYSSTKTYSFEPADLSIYDATFTGFSESGTYSISLSIDGQVVKSSSFTVTQGELDDDDSDTKALTIYGSNFDC